MRYVLGVCALVAAGGLWLVGAVPAAAGGGGCHEQTEGTGSTVDMTGFCFTPTVLHVDPGATVTWTNSDSVDHVVSGTGWGIGEDLGPGDTASHRFDSAGAYAYACYLHPGMNGVVLVGDTAQASGLPAAEASGAGGTGIPATVLAGAVGLALGVAAASGGRWLMAR